jgi:hypothetical protein
MGTVVRSNVTDVQSAHLAAFTSRRDIYEKLGMTVEDTYPDQGFC